MPPLDPAVLPLVGYTSHKVDAPGSYFVYPVFISFPFFISHVNVIILRITTFFLLILMKEHNYVGRGMYERTLDYIK